MERKNGRNEKSNGGDDNTEERYEMETQNIQNEITSALGAPKTKNRTAKNLPCVVVTPAVTNPRFEVKPPTRCIAPEFWEEIQT